MEVLVVGAGPVGLTMALELARHGLRCRVIDKLAAPSGYCKAIGVTPRTLEVWEDMGIVRDMIEAGLWLRGTRTVIAGQVSDSMVDFNGLPYGNLGIPQFATEQILAEHLARVGIGIERGIELAGLTDDGRRIAAELVHKDGSVEQAECRYVVGCDGAHSTVRRAVGIGFPGDRFPMQFMLGDVTIDWDLPRGFTSFSIVPRENNAPDFLVAIPLPERQRYRITMLAPPEFLTNSKEHQTRESDVDHGIASERPGPSLAQLQEVADRLLPGAPKLGSLRWSSLFGISTRLADRYRVGNAFIAGDAAHIHPPTGGQGMNTGIQDAYNLAWKLALVLRGRADTSLLDSYEAERRPVGSEVVARTRAASMAFGRDRANKENRLADTQILINYRDSKWVTGISPAGAGSTARAGDRAPDVVGLRHDKIGFPLRLFNLLQGTSHVLVVRLMGGEALHKLEELSLRLKKKYGEQIRVVAIARHSGEIGDFPGVTILRDEGDAFSVAYGTNTDFICLVRPDGYFAYADDALRGNQIEEAVARSLGKA